MLDYDEKILMKEIPWPYNVMEILKQEREDADLTAKNFLEMVANVLTTREQEILQARYSVGVKSLKDVGAMFNIGSERVRQIEAKAFRKLMGSHLQEYLSVPYKEWKAAIDAKLQAEEREKEANDRLTILLEKLPAAERKAAEADMHVSESERITLENLDLSVRSYNCLRRHGIHTMQDILKIESEDELKRIRNLGPKCAEEIRDKVHSLGYKFAWERWLTTSSSAFNLNN